MLLAGPISVRSIVPKSFPFDTHALESILKYENVGRLYIYDFIACFKNSGRYRF